MKTLKTAVALTSLSLLGAGAAFAHAGHGVEPSFFDGVSHQIGGLDHMLIALIAGAVGGLTVRKWAGAIGWLAGFTILFAFYHQIAFLSTLQLSSFEAGFMSAAMATMLCAYGVVKVLARTQRKIRGLS